MSDHREQIDDLLVQADDLEDGPAKIALLEEAVRLADGHDDLAEGFRTRLELIDAANFGGRPELMLVAFSWCLSQSDRDPQRFPEARLLWKYKWVVSNLPEFPQIGRDQIDSMLADLTGRYQRAGSTLHAVEDLRESLAIDMGDRAAAVAAHRAKGRIRPDRLSDCPACTLDGEITYRLFLGRYRQAVDIAGPIVNGRLKCNTVPHRTFAKLLVPLLRLGQPATAIDYHLRGYRLVARDPTFVYSFARHLTFLTLTENLARAVQLFEKHLPAALAAVSASERLEFYLASLLLLDRLAAEGKEERKLRLPASFPLHDGGGRYRVGELRDWFRREAGDLAGRFDRRNGNTYETRRLAGLRRLKKLAAAHPLPARSPAEH
jgi:hypothetical protein